MAVLERDLELWRQMSSVHRRAVREIDTSLREVLGYPALSVDALMALAGTPKGQDQMMGLSDQLGIDRSTSTRLVDQMVGAGLVRRAPHPADGRGVLVVLTSRGRRELRRALPHYLDAIRRTGIGRLTASERRALRRVLRKVSR